MTTDPVCEKQVDERKAEYVSTFEGRSFYFCSRNCQEEFDQDPRRYEGSLQELKFREPSFEPEHVPPADSEEGGTGSLLR